MFEKIFLGFRIFIALIFLIILIYLIVKRVGKKKDFEDREY